MYYSWKQTKEVFPKDIKVGDIVDTYRQDGWSRSVSDGWKVVAVAGAFVTLECRRGKPEQTTLSTEGLIFEVSLTEKEYRAKYEPIAAQIIKVLNDEPLPPMDWDSHTMDNSWADIDAWNMAASCEEHNIRIVGWFPLETPKNGWFQQMDAGIVAEDLVDGDMFWTHYKKEWIEEMTHWYEGIKADDANGTDRYTRIRDHGKT